MTRTFDARGNRYAVMTPQQLRAKGVPIGDDAAQAALEYRQWATAAIDAACTWPGGQSPDSAKAHCCDGLLVGPFQTLAPFDVLIVNTDATLAERSGNGLTIFSQALTESGWVETAPFLLNVHHGASHSGSPVPTAIEPAQFAGERGFWLDLGMPGFGPEAVSAREETFSTVLFNDRVANRVNRLTAIEAAWQHSVFVRVGNPHCVTLLSDAQHLPSFAALHEPALGQALTRIAFAAGEQGVGEPCPAGINLQWASLVGPGRLEARVFERGEGPTASSGTSASAVACAAWACGLVQAGEVQVSMPGGTAPLRLEEQAGVLQKVALFGVARRVDEAV